MHQYGVDSGDVSLVATVAKTLWQLVLGSTRRLKMLEISFSGASVSPTDPPVKLELREQSSAGTSSAFTPTLFDRADPAAIFTARNAFTAEPTDVGLVLPGPWRVTPVGGLFVYDWKINLSDLELAVSTRLGLVATSPNALTNCRSQAHVQE